MGSNLTFVSTNILFVPILLPLVAGVLVLLIPRRVKVLREILAFITAALLFAAAIRIFIDQSVEVRIPLLEMDQFYLNFDLVVTSLSAFILLFVTGFGLLIALYSAFHMYDHARPKEYYFFLLIALSGSCGVLLADHLLFFLIFWEMVTASLYFLITVGGPEGKAGATKTFAMLGFGDGCLLLGIGLLWYLSRSFSISEIHLPAVGLLPILAFVLTMIGAITKAGSMPFHSWIPAASDAAPAPAMALLPAAIDKLLGIFLVVKLATVTFELTGGLGLLLMIIGAVTIVAAVMVAMVQHDLRRLLSYHAISQVGYMLLGIGTLTPIGIAGGLFHMLNNSIYKNCLFLCTGAVEKKTGTTDLGKLGGLAAVMPVTFTACLVSALAISGVPPLNGFVSKWLVYQGVISTGTKWSFIFLVAAMFGSALTLASFVKVVYSVFLGPKTDKTATVLKEVNFGMQLPMLVLALLCLVFGVFYAFPLNRFIVPSADLQLSISGIWNSTLATGLIILGLLVGLVLYLLGRFVKSARVVPPFTGGEDLDTETGRVVGTHFYDTIKSLAGLRGIYKSQEKGHLDPYAWIGGLGLGITGVLKKIHNGRLSWYLSWSLLGMVILLVLFLLILIV